MSAPAQDRGTADAGTSTLRLASILTSGLPAMLGTDEAPATYTVPAVFSRQVSAPEKAAIHGPAAARRLAEIGYPRVTLRVSDRRLLIGNTSLHELRDGLAHELAVLLGDIDRDLGEEHDQREADAVLRRSAEAERAAGVQRLVEEIRFA